MNAPQPCWTIECRGVALAFDCVYSVARVAPVDQLLGRDAPVIFASGGAVLVVITIERDVVRDMRADPVRSAMEELIEFANLPTLSADEQMSRIFQKFEELLTRRAFGWGGLPQGAVVVLSEDACARVYRLGPVGAANLRDGRIALIHPDLRYPVLRKLGVQGRGLDESAESLMGSIEFAMTSLHELPPEAGTVVKQPITTDESLILMSRAVLPFEAPEQAETVEEWGEREAGWHYGREGVIVEICRRGYSKLARDIPNTSVPSGWRLLASEPWLGRV